MYPPGGAGITRETRKAHEIEMLGEDGRKKTPKLVGICRPWLPNK